jgi:hypothetical protein
MGLPGTVHELTKQLDLDNFKLVSIGNLDGLAASKPLSSIISRYIFFGKEKCPLNYELSPIQEKTSKDQDL